MGNKNNRSISSKGTFLFISSNPDKVSHYLPARELGYKLVLIKTKPTNKDYNLFDNVIIADLFDIKEVLSKIQEYNNQYNKHDKIVGCLTRFDAFVPLAGLICENLGLKGHSFESGLFARDKLLMRQAFEKKDIPQPIFFRIKSLDDLKIASKKLGYPFLLKPICGSKSRYIKKINNAKELAKSFNIVSKLCKKNNTNLFKNIKNINSSLNKIDKTNNNLNNFKTTFIAEEFIYGRQYTTTSLIVNKKVHHISVCDLVTAIDLGIDAFYLQSRTTPSMLPVKIQEDIYKISTKAILALGLDNCIVHPEFILTKDGPKVIEVAARIGGFRTEMTNLSFGIKLNELTVKIALGITVDVDMQKKDIKSYTKGSTAIEVWPKRSGIIKEFKNLNEVINLKGIVNFEIKKNVGERFDVPPIGEKPVAQFFTVADSPVECKKTADVALKLLDVIIE